MAVNPIPERRKINEFQNHQDHDLLIRLESKVDSFIVQYGIDIKELKDGTAITLADHEIRIKKVEALAIEDVAKKANETYQWKHDFEIKSNFLLWIVGLVGGVVGAVITVVIQLLGIFKR